MKKAEKKTETFESVVVRNGGKLDLDATMKIARENLQHQEEERKNRNVVFAEALSDIFNSNPGLKLDQASLAAAVTECLGVALSERAKMTEHALTYIQSVIGEKGEAEYGSSRGRNGGTFRWADQKEEAKKEEAKKEEASK